MPSFSDSIYNQFYPGWGRTEAEADWRATGAQKWQQYQRQQNPTAEDIAKQVLAAQAKEIEAEKSWVNQYLKENPLAFDEALAAEASKAQYLPYYSELLGDYMKDVKLKRETIQDEQKLLQNLRKLDTGARTRSYQYAVENAQEGYAGKGLFSSGMRAREVGREKIEYKTGMEGATARYEAGEQGLERQLTGYEQEEAQKRRDIFGGEEELGGLAGYTGGGGQFQTAFEGGILQREEEQKKAYYGPLQMAYAQRFPVSGNMLAGYLPPEYLQY